MFECRWTQRILLCFCMLQLPGVSLAADIPPAISRVPNVSDPGRVERMMRATTPSLPTKPQSTIQETEQESPVVGEAEKIYLTLTKVIFSGNTIFTDQELQEIFSSSRNKKISLADLQNLVAEVTKKYRAAGYILSRAILPPQEIKNGVVQVQVIEGFVSKVTVEGHPGNARSVIAKYGNRVLKVKPLQVRELERGMLLADDLPGVSVRAVITPSDTIPGSADLTLVAERNIANGYLSYDNFGTRFIGPQEIAFGGSLNSILFPGDENALHFATTPETSRMKFMEYIHSNPVGENGMMWFFGTNYTETNPGFMLSEVDIQGRNFAAFSNLSYPVIRSRNENLYVRAAINYQNVVSTVLDFPFYQDYIRSLTLSASYNTVDRWSAYNTVDVSAGHGFDILGANQHLFQSRPKGHPDYTKANLTLSRLQPIVSRLSVYGAAQGQYAFNALLATEQYGFGGSIYGRGYGPSEIVGDRGAAGKVELRWDSFYSMRLLQAVEYYTFYDMGAIWNINHVSQPAKQSGTSAGLGARFNFMPKLSGNVYLAKPLSRQALTLTPTDQNGRQARVFFQITASV